MAFCGQSSSANSATCSLSIAAGRLKQFAAKHTWLWDNRSVCYFKGSKPVQSLIMHSTEIQRSCNSFAVFGFAFYFFHNGIITDVISHVNTNSNKSVKM